MRAETRHQLKQDRFSRTTFHMAEKTVHWTVEHRSKLIASTIAVLLLAAVGAGSWYYLNQRDQEASAQLTGAVRVMDTPIRPAGSPPQADSPSFGSFRERALEARQRFQAVWDKYPHTRSGEIAHYFVGITSTDLSDNSAAERELKAVGSSGNDDLSALANLALASVYRQENRNKEAIELYKKLAAKPTRAVGKTTAELQMADTYMSDRQPLEAKRVYEQVHKENPSTAAGQLAAQKLGQLK